MTSFGSVSRSNWNQGKQMRVGGWLPVVAVLLCSTTVLADPGNGGEELSTEGNVGVGWMVLPGVDVCSSGGCTQTDSSFLFHLIARVHLHQNWAVGAGAGFAFWPTAHPPLSEQDESTGRTVSRSYLAITGQVLYFPWRKTAEVAAPFHTDYYFGVDAGVGLLTDRYQSPAFDEQGAIRIGEPGSTLRNEGVLARGLFGVDLGLSSHLAMGFSLQAGGLWFPVSKQTTFLDPSTVTGLSPWISATLELKAHIGL